MTAPTTPPRVLRPREIADKWAVEAQNMPFEASRELKAAATTWLTFLTGALGALTIGGITFLPGEVTKVADSVRNWVILLLFAATLLGLVSRTLATLASQVTPVTTYTDGPTLRRLTQESNLHAAKRLIQSQQLASWAIALLLTAAFLGVAVSDPAPSAASSPLRLVHQIGGPTLCGRLVADDDGALSIASGSRRTKLRNVRVIAEIPKCPAQAE